MSGVPPRSQPRCFERVVAAFPAREPPIKAIPAVGRTDRVRWRIGQMMSVSPAILSPAAGDAQLPCAQHLGDGGSAHRGAAMIVNRPGEMPRWSRAIEHARRPRFLLPRGCLPQPDRPAPICRPGVEGSGSAASGAAAAFRSLTLATAGAEPAKPLCLHLVLGERGQRPQYRITSPGHTASAPATAELALAKASE
jgi:hypothetical protein